MLAKRKERREKRKKKKKNLSQKKRSKEASRARTASGPGRWCFILYVCKTQRHCVTHAIRFLQFFFCFLFFQISQYVLGVCFHGNVQYLFYSRVRRVTSLFSEIVIVADSCNIKELRRSLLVFMHTSLYGVSAQCISTHTCTLQLLVRTLR